MNAEREPVLFLLNALGIGGSERKTVAVVNELHRTGWDVHLAYLDPRTPLLGTIAESVSVIYLNRKGKKLSISAIRDLRDYISHQQIAKLVCINLYPLLYAQAAVALLSSHQKPMIVLASNSTEHVSRKNALQMIIYKPLIRRVPKIVFGCRTQMQLWAKRYVLDKKKCTVIYNGIDQDWFQPRQAGFQEIGNLKLPGIADTDFIIGGIGNLWSNKNHVEIIYALDRIRDSVPNAKLLIAGEGPERERLESTAASLDLEDRVVLLGEIQDIRPLLHRLDVFILPSITETFSNAALEAMSMERPVILSRTGGLPEMVTDGVDGYLYQQGGVDQLAALITRIAKDSSLARRVGVAARNTVLARFSFGRMANDYRRLLGGACDGIHS